MMNNGTYNRLYIKVTDTYYPIGCLTNNSFNESTEVISSTTRDNTNGWGTVTPTNQSFSLSFSGLVGFDDLGGTVVSYGMLQTLKRARTKIEWKIYSELGGDTETGFGYIISLSNAAAIDEAVSFDGEITGFGMPTTTAGIPEDPLALIDMLPIYEAAKY